MSEKNNSLKIYATNLLDYYGIIMFLFLSKSCFDFIEFLLIDLLCYYYSKKKSRATTRMIMFVVNKEKKMFKNRNCVMSQSQRTLRRVLKHNEKSFQLCMLKVKCIARLTKTKVVQKVVWTQLETLAIVIDPVPESQRKPEPNSTQTQPKLDANSPKFFFN